MKKVLALVLAVAMLATMGGVALAQGPVEPAEVNIVLPPGSVATVEKAVEITEFYYGEQGVSETVIGTQEISVTEGYLDIKPGSYPNSINTKKNGVTPVALLGYDGFDVRTVDVATLTFGPNDAIPAHDLTDPETYEEHIQDVNFDGNDDLVCHFRTKDAGLTTGMLSADLDYDTTTISDSVRVIK